MKKTILLFAVLFVVLFSAGCKSIFGPDDDESKPVTDKIVYVRTEINCPTCMDFASLNYKLSYPDGYKQGAVEMGRVTQTTFETNLQVYTEKLNEIWVIDPKLKLHDDMGDSYTHVATEIHVNNVRVYKSVSMGSAPWCGVVRYIHKNDGRIVQ